MTDLLKCAWLIDDEGGRCGASSDMSVGHEFCFAFCSGGMMHAITAPCATESEARAEWNRNQLALTDGPDAAAWFEETQSSLLLVQEVEEQRDELRGALSDMTASRDESLKTLTGVYNGRTIATKERDELRREVAGFRDVQPEIAELLKLVRAATDALGPLASGDLAGDVKRLMRWMETIHSDDVCQEEMIAASFEYEIAMEGKTDDCI